MFLIIYIVVEFLNFMGNSPLHALLASLLQKENILSLRPFKSHHIIHLVS